MFPDAMAPKSTGVRDMSAQSLKTLLVAFAAACGIAAPAYSADARCDTPGVAQMIVPDMFNPNHGAQKLGLEVDSVTMVRVEDDGSCIVSVGMNHGYTMTFRFRYSPTGEATLDVIPAPKQ
jgi:hypothetical protein